MKKYAVLVLCTALVVGGLFAVRAATVPHVTEVTTVTLKQQTVTQTVDCAGRVEIANSENVFIEWPCVAGNVFVTVGEQVQAGQALFDVDAHATSAVLSGLGTPIPDGLYSEEQTVSAPVSGKVVQVNVKEGQITDQTQPCVTIAPDDSVCIAVTVREKHLRDVQIGQRVTVSGVGFAKEQYSGTLVSLEDSAHQQYVGSVSETVVDGVVALDKGQSDPSLRVGLGAVASVTVKVTENALLVPYDCVAQNEKGEEYVYVYTDGVARRRVIQSAADYAEGTLLVSGVSAGERLVRYPDTLSGESLFVREGE